METETTCQACGQRYGVVVTTRKAHPLNAEGQWTPRTPSATTTRNDLGALTTWTWACHCGADVTATRPGWEVVACQYGAGERDGCWKHEANHRPPSDIYTNPRHGAACACCGHQGVHLVRKDRHGHVPTCLKVSV